MYAYNQYKVTAYCCLVIPGNEGIILSTANVIPGNEGIIPSTANVIPGHEGIIPSTPNDKPNDYILVCFSHTNKSYLTI